MRIFAFEYDANGNVDFEISSNGITIDYDYDRLNRMTSKSYESGTEIMTYGFKYDNNSNLEEVTYPEQVKKDTFTYNSRDLLETETSGSELEASTIEYKYTANGKLFSKELLNSELEKNTYGYDGHSRLRTVSGPYNTTTYGYDKNSNLVTVDAVGNTDSKSLNLVYDYDQLNRFTHHKLKKADGVYIVTELGYNKAGHMNKLVSPNNHTWGITPNGAGLPHIVEDPLKNKDVYSYDHRDLLGGIEDNEAGGRLLTHNFKHNVLGDTWRMGDSFRGIDKYKYEYNAAKEMLEFTEDPAGGLVNYKYDGLNRISSVTRKIKNESGSGYRDAMTQYKYTGNGKLERIIDDAGNFTRYVYDSKDRLTDIFYPETTGSVHFTYHKDDQVRTYTDLNGTMFTNTYDAAGRLKTRTIVPASGVGGTTAETYGYDDLGRLNLAEDNDSIVTFEYNTAGRLFKETQNIKASVGNVIITYVVGYEYDDNGNRTKLTYPSKANPSDPGSSNLEIVFIPDKLDRIDKIFKGVKIIADYDYEGKGKITDKKLFNETVAMKSVFDDGRRPVSLTYKSGDNKLFERVMSWNLMDMKLTETGPDIAKEYKYDNAWRLRKDINKNNNVTGDFSDFYMDNDENLESIRTYKNGMFVQALKCEHNNKRHQLTSVDYFKAVDNQLVEFHVEPSYDQNGNMKSFVHNYTYNYRNQLIEVVTGTGVIVKYKYDALGRRIEKLVSDPGGEEITRYVHDGWRVIEERKHDNTLRWRYTYGNGIDERVAMEYNTGSKLVSLIPMHDSTGNVIGVSDDTGKLIEKYAYSTYGAPVFGYDTVNPTIKNIYVIDGKVITVYSESVKVDSATSSILIKHEGSQLSGSFEQSEDGKELSFTPSTPLTPGQISIDIDESIEDQSGNQLGSSFSRDFVYTGTTTVGYDSSPPEVDRIEKISTDFIVTFNERIDGTTAINSIEIKRGDGSVSGSVSTVNDRTFKFTPDEMLEAGKEYAFWVSSTLKDLSGKSVNEFFHSFVVLNDDFLVYKKSDPNKHTKSNIDNNYLFHGRTYEPEIGLYYYRNRYYLPRIGRFLQTDPMGYEDSMNLYQAFGMNPVNFRDPMGTELSADTIKYWGSYEKALKYVKYNYGLYLSGGDSADTAYKKLVSNGLVTAGDQVFALKLALSPSLDVFDVTPAQFGKDLAGGVISAGTKLGSLVAKGLPGCSNQYLWAQIDKAQNLVQSKINKAIGANEGSLGYWIGETYAPVIAGGWLSAEIELANATAQTGKTLPFLSKPVVSESNLELANALEGLGFEGKQIERIIAARESGQPLVLIGEFQPRVDKMAGFLDKLGLKIQRYVPRNEVAGVTRGALEANRGWLRYWTKKKGGLVIDLGPIPGNVAPTRQFYIVEHGSIYKNWKYKNFIKFKSKF